MTVLNIDDVLFEETEARLKIVIPLKRPWLYILIYTVLLIVWVGMVGYGVIYTWQTAFSGERYAFGFTFLLLLFLFVLYRLGKTLWRQWQYHIASREILFLYDDHMIIRRPVSLLGTTTGYDRQYMRPFYYDDERKCPAFEYGNIYVLFGQSLPRPDAEIFVHFLNGRYFPDFDEDDD